MKAAHEQSRIDPATLKISVDTKAKVAVGHYARGERTRTGATGEVPEGWDHDPPARQKHVPFGILMPASER